MNTRGPIARRWYEWKLNEQRIIQTLDCYELQKQVGKFDASGHDRQEG